MVPILRGKISSMNKSENWRITVTRGTYRVSMSRIFIDGDRDKPVRMKRACQLVRQQGGMEGWPLGVQGMARGWLWLELWLGLQVAIQPQVPAPRAAQLWSH